MHNPNLAYTPKFHIPLGEPIYLEDGTPALKLKKGERIETVTAKNLLEICFGDTVWTDLMHTGCR